METDNLIAFLALLLTLVSSIINGIYTYYTNKKLDIFKKEKLKLDISSLKEQSLKILKNEIYEYRKTLISICKNQHKILVKEKDVYSFYTVLTIQNLKDCLGEDKYIKYLDLSKEVDILLDLIVYKNQYDNQDKIISLIKDFLETIDEITFG